MNEDLQFILRCGQCNKPFDEQSTLKRHGYYCRARRAGSITRPRSCISCARGKARCDNRRPACSRCIIKTIECHYPPIPPKSTTPRIQHSADAPTERRKLAPSLNVDSPSVENRQEASNDGDTSLGSAQVISDLEFPNIGGDYLTWDVPDIDFADFLVPQTIDEPIQYPSFGSSSLARHSIPSKDHTVQVQKAISSRKVSIPPIPNSTLRSLIQRPNVNTGAQRIANLILHTLKSYPRMMLRHSTVPPFIHPGLISSGVENNSMEPLTNCINLVYMIRSGVQGSRRLFWRNVRFECEHLCAEHLNFNKWELLAAMQALSIYILIRLDEGETDYNNFDFLLLAAVTIIAQQLARSDTQSALCNYGLEASWKDWIYEESRRRVSVVYRVVNMLIYFWPAALCELQTDLILAPLPARKQLWEAGDEFVWKLESEKEPKAETDFGLAANGELVKIEEGQLYCGDTVLRYKPLDDGTPPRSTENWEEWCSGMDGLGGLVMLAASLIV